MGYIRHGLQTVPARYILAQRRPYAVIYGIEFHDLIATMSVQ